MIIHSIELKHVGSLGASAKAGPFDSGLNILAANNEEGKTTLVRAASRGLFDRHTCRADEIKALQPVGTTLGPCVVITLQHLGKQYQIEKVFLTAPRSSLRQWVRDKWELKAEGDDADSKLQFLLQSDQPGRGATKAEHWGLFQYLWARQGEPATWPGWEGESGQAVRSSLVKIELDALIERLRGRLLEVFNEVFTDTGRERKGGPLETANIELGKLKEKLELSRSQSQDLESDQAKFQTLDEEIMALEREVKEKRNQANTITNAAQEAEATSRELVVFQDKLTTAKSRLHGIQTIIEDSERLNKSIFEFKETVQHAQSTVEALNKQIGQATEERSQAEKHRDSQQIQKDGIQARLERVRKVLKWRDAIDRASGLQKQYKKVQQQQTEIDRQEEELARKPALTSQKLKTMQELEQEIRDLSSQISVIGITVEIKPNSARKIEVTESSMTTSHPLKAKETKTITTGGPIELQLEAWGQIQIRSGATELRELREAHDTKSRSLQDALEPLGVTTVANAIALLEKRKELEKNIKEGNRTLKALLADFESTSSLELEKTRVTTLESSFQSSLTPTSEEKEISIVKLQNEEETSEVSLKDAEKKAQQASKNLQSLERSLAEMKSQRSTHETSVKVQEGNMTHASDQLERIRKQYPEGLDSAKQKAQQEFAEAEARVAATQKKLPPDSDKLPDRSKRAARAAEEASTNLENRKSQRSELAGKLKTLGAQGVYSRETDLLERIQAKALEADASQHRGWSARLIVDLIDRHKQAATRSVLTPLQNQLSSTFAQLTSNPNRRVFLNESLQLLGIGVDESQLVPFEAMSQGAKEQLLLALRIAVAKAVSETEPQLLILDDVLVNTDPIRQERVLDVLQDAAQHLQILILTCHADRYRGIGHIITLQRDGSE